MAGSRPWQKPRVKAACSSSVIALVFSIKRTGGTKRRDVACELIQMN
jgi:hypothetical protein